MRAEYPRSREEWFIPHETMITLPDGRELIVAGIPIEGWGTAPGVWGIIRDFEETGQGGFACDFEVRWVVPHP